MPIRRTLKQNAHAALVVLDEDTAGVPDWDVNDVDNWNAMNECVQDIRQYIKVLEKNQRPLTRRK